MEALYLISPEHSISLLALGLAPDLEQLLDAPFADLVSSLLGFRPLQRRTQGSVVDEVSNEA